MDIRELRIGDKVVDRASGFVFIVTGLFAPEDVQAVPDVEDYEGDVWEFSIHELEKYRIPLRDFELKFFRYEMSKLGISLCVKFPKGTPRGSRYALDGDVLYLRFTDWFVSTNKKEARNTQISIYKPWRFSVFTLCCILMCNIWGKNVFCPVLHGFLIDVYNEYGWEIRADRNMNLRPLIPRISLERKIIYRDIGVKENVFKYIEDIMQSSGINTPT